MGQSHSTKGDKHPPHAQQDKPQVLIQTPSTATKDVSSQMHQIQWPQMPAPSDGPVSPWPKKEQLRRERNVVISAIISSGSPTMMPNPHSMRSYLEAEVDKRTFNERRAIMGRYWRSWYAPMRRAKTAPRHAPISAGDEPTRGADEEGDPSGKKEDYEVALPAIPKDVVSAIDANLRGKLEEVMMGFSMSRPSGPTPYSWYFYTEEPECQRPKTAGLPPFNEDQIQLVENRINWCRHRKCISWARNLLATGCTHALITTACTQAWSEWYPEGICATLKATAAWKLMQRSCKLMSEQCVSFMCGAHPRVGKSSPLSALGYDVLRCILMMFGRLRSCEFDGMHREPPLTEYEKSFEMSYKWPPPSEFAVCAFGNFDTEQKQSYIALSSLVFAYAIVYEFGPWISLEDFVSGVEVGNVGNLQCFAFLQHGAHANTPQERFMAIRLHETLFGVLSESKESKFRKCFTGDGFVLMANGSRRRARDIHVGDSLKTESGTKKVCRVEMRTVNCAIPMCEVSGVWLTPGHPVLVGGTWKHPFEIVPVTTVFVADLFNFELSGGPLSHDHSVWINGLLVCTLGKNCGPRIVTGWPRADDVAGTGYWRNGSSYCLRQCIKDFVSC
ncbi:hypothetical protein Pelo_9027 [Pelomyxa schiedti]|nr:hypothetical protein Pelo_9027 [Pelomyxa schiedti]